MRREKLRREGMKERKLWRTGMMLVEKDGQKEDVGGGGHESEVLLKETEDERRRRERGTNKGGDCT